MTLALSFYLDLLRFGAALTVFVSHYAAGRIGGGLFWQAGSYSRTAVLAFFVLSGFVIAWVTEAREDRLGDYALSRAARLYSVVIPAFILTAVLNRLGSAIDPRLYAPVLSDSTFHAFAGYALSALFLGESWALAILPGRNVPFWSLNYEAWYYILFAAAIFLRGRRRNAVLAGAALLAGPKILLLFPIWLLGVGAWRWRARLPSRWGEPLLVAALTALLGLEAMGGQDLFWHPEANWLPPSYSAYDYVIGALIALVILALANAKLPMPGSRWEGLVRWLAGTSFGLYLLHYPLLNFLAAMIPGPADDAIHRILVFVLALGMAVALARFIEPRKAVLRRGLLRGFEAVSGKHPTPAIEGQRAL